MQLAAIDQFFQRSAAAAGGVKRQAIPLRLKVGNQRLNAGRGDAKHRQANRGLVVGIVDGGEAYGPGYLARRVAEHPSRDAVQTGEIGDRIQHVDVTGADIGGNVTRRHA